MDPPTSVHSPQAAPAPASEGPFEPKVRRLVVATLPPNAETNETRNVNTRDNWQTGSIYERLFANTAYWKQIGEEYQNPLIVTGTVLFMPHSRQGMVQRDVEQFDSVGRRRVVPVRTFMERKGFILAPRFVFIDGRTGATMYAERYREEILYNSQQNTPALSSYFELMDRLIPSFLNTLSSQKVKGTRVLLQ